MWLKKSLEMFNLSKSPEDLQDKNIVQHKVLCDWLRNIQAQNIQLARKLTLLQKSVDSILENEGSADIESHLEGMTYDDSSPSRSVS